MQNLATKDKDSDSSVKSYGYRVQKALDALVENPTLLVTIYHFLHDEYNAVGLVPPDGQFGKGIQLYKVDEAGNSTPGIGYGVTNLNRLLIIDIEEMLHEMKRKEAGNNGKH